MRDAGPGMLAVLAAISDRPGCSKADASRQASYDSVQRVIRRGWVREDQHRPGANYRLYLTEAGRRFLAVAPSIAGDASPGSAGG